MNDKLGIEPAAPEPLGDSEGTATQVVAGLEPVALEYCGRCDKHTIPCDFYAVLYSAATVEQLVQERDELKKDVTFWNTTFLDARKGYEEQLAASQAREKQLREALDICKREMQGDKWDALYIDGVLASK